MPVAAGCAAAPITRACGCSSTRARPEPVAGATCLPAAIVPNPAAIISRRRQADLCLCAGPRSPRQLPTLALSAAEHCRGRHAVAQSDWRSRTATRLVEDFTGPVLTDLFQHCRGFSFAWLPREPRWDAKLSPPNPPELISGSVQPINHPLFAQVRALIDKGKTWVKLSGAYADTKVGPPTYADSTAVAQAYAKAAPERCVWGSDWPHPSERERSRTTLCCLISFSCGHLSRRSVT